MRALDASGALAVNSDLLSWFLAVGRKCQHLILGHMASFELLAHRAYLPPTAMSDWSANRSVAATRASRMPGSENA